VSRDGVAVGIDIGGTFSDVVAVSSDREVLAAFKVPSTPGEPEVAVLDGLRQLSMRFRELGLDTIRAAMFHGTTIATNALIQKRGARTALLSTEGFTDVVALRRQARPDLYRLDQHISPPLAAPRDRFGVAERISADGTVLEQLRPEDIRKIAAELRAAGVESVALCFLHSYANPVHERAAAELLREELPEITVSASSELNPEVGEFERTSTTLVNAYVTPSVREYLGRLRHGCAEHGIDEFLVVKSNGGLTSSTNAAHHPVHLIESGPAAGLSAVAQLGRRLGLDNLIAFDMGGTTAKIGVIREGVPQLARELFADRYVDGRDVGGYVIRSPVIDLAEIGAGGGSIAWLDAGGALRIGPHSAGSDPGPACYGMGNSEPTITDAHLVIGTLDTASEAVPEDLDVELARNAIQTHVAGPLGWDTIRAAHAILRLATANMAEIVRLVTVRRGLDVRDFTLVCYGGAGPLHATDIAAEVGISRIVVPAYPAMFSALGALMCDVRHDLVQTMTRVLTEVSPPELARVFDNLAERAADLLATESSDLVEGPVRFQRLLDVRHEGQLHDVAIPIGDEATVEGVEQDFRRRYREQYGYTLPDSRLELVNARLEVVMPRWRDGEFPSGRPTRTPTRPTSRQVLGADGRSQSLPVISRVEVTSQGEIPGPVLVADAGSVTPVHAGQVVRPLGAGAILIMEGSRDR
jgi:N-methylhydantoinase A